MSNAMLIHGLFGHAMFVPTSSTLLIHIMSSRVVATPTIFIMCNYIAFTFLDCTIQKLKIIIELCNLENQMFSKS